MSRRAATVLISGIAAAMGVADGARGQQPGLRGTSAPAVAQQPVAAESTDPASLVPQSPPDPATLIEEQASAVSRGAPTRASRPVQGRSVHGVTRRQFRAPQPDVTGLPPAPEPAPVPPRRRAPEEDAYAALGLRLGSVTLKPAITGFFGYDTNPQRSSGPAKGSHFGRYEAELGIQSDWNVHELKGMLRGAYNQYFDDHEASRPEGEGNLDLRLDASRDTRILLESRFRLDTQRPGSPDLTAAVVGRPLTYAFGGSAGVTHDINRLQLTLRGSVDRLDYQDATLSNGATLSQADRNQTQYELRLRAAYELTPGVKPFVEGEIDRRQFDEKVDSSGYARSSNGVGGSIGSTFELSRQLTGEVAVGFQDRNYEDPRLKNLRGPVGHIAILWTPTPLTTVTLRGSSELGDTTIAGSSGTTARRVNLEVAHALRRNLTVTGLAGFGRTIYEGQGLREDFTSLGVRLEYRLTRTFAIRAGFTHERLNSTSPGSDYTANVSQVGLRVQF